jgi:hypothetical protein
VQPDSEMFFVDQLLFFMAAEVATLRSTAVLLASAWVMYYVLVSSTFSYT